MDPAPAAAGPPSRRTLAPGAAMTSVTQVVAAASGALVGIAVARLLGPDGMGAFAIAMSLLLVLSALATVGLETGTVYLVGRGAWPARRAWLETQGAAVVLGLLGAGAGVAARVLAPNAFEGLSLGLVAIVVAALPFFLSWQFASSVLVALDRYEDYVFPALVYAVSSAALVAALASVFGLEGAVAGLVGAHVLAAAASALRTRRAVAASVSHVAGLGHLRRAAAFGSKTYVANALQFVNYRLDFFVLNAVAAQEAVGHYAVAVAVTSLGWLLPRSLSVVVFPRVAALAGGAGDDLRAQHELVETKSARHAVLLGAGSALVLAVVLLALVPPVFGSAFRPAVGLGLILLPGVVLMGVAGVLMATVVGRGFPHYSLFVSLVSAPVTVALYLLLIPRLEATGAALASVLSYALTFALSVLFYRRARGGGVGLQLVPTRGELADYRLLYRGTVDEISRRRRRR